MMNGFSEVRVFLQKDRAGVGNVGSGRNVGSIFFSGKSLKMSSLPEVT